MTILNFQPNISKLIPSFQLSLDVSNLMYLTSSVQLCSDIPVYFGDLIEKIATLMQACESIFSNCDVLECGRCSDGCELEKITVLTVTSIFENDNLFLHRTSTRLFNRHPVGLETSIYPILFG